MAFCDVPPPFRGQANADAVDGLASGHRGVEEGTSDVLPRMSCRQLGRSMSGRAIRPGPHRFGLLISEDECSRLSVQSFNRTTTLQ